MASARWDRRGLHASVHGELAGDDGGAQTGAVFDDFEEVGGSRRRDGGEAEIVDHEDPTLAQAFMSRRSGHLP